MRGFKVDAVKFVDSALEFALPGLPGDPRFSGKLATDGASIAGDFSQGGSAMPFHVERAAKPASTADENAVPAKGEAGKGFAGKWRGAIKPVSAIELRLQAELQSDGAGELSGDLISLDQGAARMPIEAFTEKDGTVQFDLPRIRGGSRASSAPTAPKSPANGVRAAGPHRSCSSVCRRRVERVCQKRRRACALA